MYVNVSQTCIQAPENHLEMQTAPESAVNMPKTVILAGNRISTNHEARPSVAPLRYVEKDDLASSTKRKRSNSPTSVHEAENVSPKRLKCESS